MKVRFVVEKDGTVSNIQALSGADILQKEAIRVIKLSNQWEPATMGALKVRAYKIQPIVFELKN